jgi:hypothetical protein
MILRVALAVALAAVLAPSNASACSGTLSGPVVATFECTVAVTPGKDGQFSIVVAPSGTIPGVEQFLPATFEFAGRPAVGTFNLGTFTGARASIQAKGKVTYRAGLAAGKRQGEVTLNIHTVEREARGGYTVSGSMTARLVPASGTGAPVVMQIAF